MKNTTHILKNLSQVKEKNSTHEKIKYLTPFVAVIVFSFSLDLILRALDKITADYFLTSESAKSSEPYRSALISVALGLIGISVYKYTKFRMKKNMENDFWFPVSDDTKNNFNQPKMITYGAVNDREFKQLKI